MEQISISGVIHWSWYVILSIYAFIFPRNWFDYVYIYYWILIFLQWTLINGECIITYYSKTQIDPSYKAGKNPMDNRDMYVLPISDEMNNLIIQVLLIVWLVNMYIVYNRNRFPRWISITFVISFIIYKWLMITNENLHENEKFQLYQRVISYVLLGLLAATWYYTKHK